MEDLLFHATLISDITDHSKFMDTILFTKLSCFDVALLLLLLLLLLLFVLFLVVVVVFGQTFKSTMPSTGHSPWYKYHGRKKQQTSSFLPPR